MTTLQPTDITVEIWPPHPAQGLRVGMPKGVKVTHKPTGLYATCDSERSQHRCRDTALCELEAKVEKEARRIERVRSAIDRRIRSETPDASEDEIAALVDDELSERECDRSSALADERMQLGDLQDDSPSLEHCDDAGTGEGRYHGRI